jgi:WD40 repeat protein
LASGSQDKTVRLWDPITGAPVGEPLAGHQATVNSVAFGTGPDGRLLLASSGVDRAVRLWDPVTGASIGELLGQTDIATSLAFGTRQDRLLLAVGNWDGPIQLWDAITGAPVGKPLTGHTDRVSSVAFGTDLDGQPLLASGSQDKTVRLWNLTTGTCIATLQRRSNVRSIMPTSNLLAIGDSEGIYAIEWTGWQYHDQTTGQATW